LVPAAQLLSQPTAEADPFQLAPARFSRNLVRR
jgi:hypothetical protein